jgi:hypothetical protein
MLEVQDRMVPEIGELIFVAFNRTLKHGPSTSDRLDSEMFKEYDAALMILNSLPKAVSHRMLSDHLLTWDKPCSDLTGLHERHAC